MTRLTVVFIKMCGIKTTRALFFNQDVIAKFILIA